MNIDIDEAVKEAFQNAHRIKTSLMEAEWDAEYFDDSFEFDFKTFTDFLVSQDNVQPLSLRVAALKGAVEEFTALIFLEDQKNINAPQDIRDAHNELITNAEHYLQTIADQLQRVYKPESSHKKMKV